MPQYDDTLFVPPAPVIRVSLRTPDNRAEVNDVPMLIDSGSDVTLLPKAFVEQLGVAANTETEYTLTGFDGSVSVTQAVGVHLFFLGKTFRGQFLLIEQEWGILGRDILNFLCITLNGPKQQWEER